MRFYLFLFTFCLLFVISKSKVGDTDIKSYRILKLSHFINIYNSIKQHTEALKVFQPEFNSLSLEKKLNEVCEGTSDTFSEASNIPACSKMSTDVNKNPQNQMTESKIFDL